MMELQQTKVKIGWPLIVLVAINIGMIAYFYWASTQKVASALDFNTKVANFVDSISQVKLKELQHEFVRLDSARIASEQKTVEKKHDYENIKKPVDRRVITTSELDSFWKQYRTD